MNQTNLHGLRRAETKTVNDLQVVTYTDGKENVITTVRTGKTQKGSLLFESPDPIVAETFATMHPELINRSFRNKDKKLFNAWFSKQYPNHMFGTEQYDRFRGQLVKFEQHIDGQPFGYIKIF